MRNRRWFDKLKIRRDTRLEESDAENRVLRVQNTAVVVVPD
jgi:hypothetical protein